MYFLAFTSAEDLSFSFWLSLSICLVSSWMMQFGFFYLSFFICEQDYRKRNYLTDIVAEGKNVDVERSERVARKLTLFREFRHVDVGLHSLSASLF